MDPIIIAVDGFSSCGKSTLAKALAKRLNYAYMDTGAMYRALTLYFLRNNINLKSCSEAEINTLIDQVDIQFKKDTNSNGTITMLNGEAVEDEIRGKKVSAEVSTVAQNKDRKSTRLNSSHVRISYAVFCLKKKKKKKKKKQKEKTNKN